MSDQFNPLRYPILLLRPNLVSMESAWVAHIPLAYLLTQLARPRVFVELGTHHGDSYCAFCQAIVELKLDTRCWAVDTWRGDEQAGFYSPQVLENLRKHHDPRYAAFSTLLQTDFDSAVKQFDDGKIDLLHVDGHHGYESVKHDYETWLPKMSPSGVMLFHDSNARQDASFGVWKLWEELAAKHPHHFHVLHAYGLGVVAVGSEPPLELTEFLSYCRENDATMQSFFAEMGQRIFAVQLMLRVAVQMSRSWELLTQWRQATQQPPLPPLKIDDVVFNPMPFAHVVSEEIYRLANSEIALRQQLQQARQRPGA